MSATATYSRQNTFFVCLSQAKSSTLLLDYDGTLAPFTPDRSCAHPYPSVPELLNGIHASGQSRLVIISGRPAREIPPLLGLRVCPEVWGSHGMERLTPDGQYKVATLSPRIAAAFAKATEALEWEGLNSHIECKPGALAVHWRGLPHDETAEVWTTALRVLQPIAFSSGLDLSNFDGGVEMRLRTPTKGDAVAAVLKGNTRKGLIAYLGDDVTDEDAFDALNPLGLTVLVRSECRPTSAQLWLRPPAELVLFLQQWLVACGGDL
jgi:trehalose-phosphatase